MDNGYVHSVPVLYTRGTNYEVGYNIGKSFGSLIQDFLNDLDFYNKVSLQLYQLPEGRKIYENVLKICNEQYPQYVKEIQGMADGAGLPFHKLFVLHVEHLMMADESALNCPKSDHGCTDIMCNNGTEVGRLKMIIAYFKNFLGNNNHVILGHTEDAFPQCYGRTYIVHAEIVDDDGKVVEQFASVSYPGYLPGYTMGFNEHGMMHSINTVNPEKRNPNGTPREFLARALLGKKMLEEVLAVLKNPGYGIADGFNLNIHFANQTGPKVVYSIEVGPGQSGKSESELDILEVPVGDSYFHCNRYLRLPIENVPNFFSVSTDFRQQTLKTFHKAKSFDDVKRQLSDKSNPKWPVYRVGIGEDKGKTVLTGIFDTSNKTWNIYTGPSVSTNPVAVIKMIY